MGLAIEYGFSTIGFYYPPTRQMHSRDDRKHSAQSGLFSLGVCIFVIGGVVLIVLAGAQLLSGETRPVVNRVAPYFSAAATAPACQARPHREIRPGLTGRARTLS